MKMLRVTAFVLRFIRNLRAKVKKETTLNKYVINTEIIREVPLDKKESK